MYNTLPLLILAILLQNCAGTGKVSESRQSNTEAFLSYTSAITPDYLRSHLEVIAHDSLQGRDTGTEGEDMAAQYLINQYKDLGVSPKGIGNSYLQPFTLNAERTDSLIYDLFTIENEDTLLIHRSAVASGSPGDFIRLFGGAVTSQQRDNFWWVWHHMIRSVA